MSAGQRTSAPLAVAVFMREDLGAGSRASMKQWMPGARLELK
jgi:hypothetical protein